mgnify:CR=1 FL=1
MHNEYPVCYEVGDIVRENEVIAWYDNSPLMGIVIKVQRDYYRFYSDYFFVGQDRLTIMWFGVGFIEELPSDLVHLVARQDEPEK